MNNVIEEKLSYFCDHFLFRIEWYEHLRLGEVYFSPRSLCQEILIEIETNLLKNQETKKVLYKFLDGFCKSQSFTKRSIYSGLIYLRKIFNTSPVHQIKSCTESIIASIDESLYSREISFELIELISSEKNLNEAKSLIIELANEYIQELIDRGFNLEYLRKIPNILFSSYRITENGYIITDFPHEISIEDIPEQKNTQEKIKIYNEKIKYFLDSLTLIDRIHKLVYFVDISVSIYYYIFRIIGLRLTDELTIGNAVFYNPYKRKFINCDDESISRDESFGNKEEYYFCNVAVKVETVDIRSGIREALDEVLKSFTIIRKLFRIKGTLAFDESKVIVVDDDKKFAFESSTKSSSEEWFVWHDSIDLDVYIEIVKSEKTEFLAKIMFDNEKSNTKRIISSSLEWYRKAEESSSQEDKLLFYWISIENFFNFQHVRHEDYFSGNKEIRNKFDVIRYILPIWISLGFLYSVGWDFFHLLRNKYNSSIGHERLFKIPEDIASDLYLTPSHKTIKLADFLAKLSKLEKYILEGSLLEQFQFVKHFYLNKNAGFEIISSKIDPIKADLQLIYVTRNRIVHNAIYHKQSLSNYVQKCNYMALMTIDKCINSQSNIISVSGIEDIITRELVESELKLLTLKTRPAFECL